MTYLAYEYWNANGYATAVVAVPGEADDWAAYIGAQPDPASKEETLEWVARYGSKLSERQAKTFFEQYEFPKQLLYRR